MAFLGILLLVALMIPIIGIVIDSPIGRAIARRVEGPEQIPSNVADLARKLEALEGEVDDLQRSVQALQEENQFLQRLLEENPRSSLPPPPKP
jgi:peptidoglycan hydrolase CwlO-like protein